jgi:protein-export membrane protein SecD
MDRSLKWRLGLVLAIFVVSLYFAFPTLRLAGLSKTEQAAMDPAALSALKNKSVKLGLDLQGGMYLVLEVDRSKLEGADLKDVVGRAEAIIRNRVDKFGVAEPVIHSEGQDRIVVQLAGLSDPMRAKELVGQTALLEFKIVREGDDFRRVLTAIDNGLKDEIKAITGPMSKEEFEAELSRAASETDTTGLRTELEAEAATGKTLTSLINFARVGTHEDATVDEKDIETVKRIVALADAKHLIAPDVQILWDRNLVESPGGKFQRIYLVSRKASLTGKYVSTAIVRFGQDPAYPSAPGVSLDFNRLGRSLFAKVTGENVDRRLAIVLDDNVHSAPNIREKIKGGAAITGSFTSDQAKDLAIVLEAGALPAPLQVAEERTVGPSLGQDSIHKGVRSALAGGIAVLVFMAIYYSLAGVVADIAVLLNVLILIAAMAALRGTLTLPGFAGIILTVGMAVDANVLIYERIREELRTGKTVRRAIKDGYARAFITIFDSNLTTLIAAGILYQFGTGPIKGFAITLSIGLVASMFTSIVVTRVIFDMWTGLRNVTKLHV